MIKINRFIQVFGTLGREKHPITLGVLPIEEEYQILGNLSHWSVDTIKRSLVRLSHSVHNEELTEWEVLPLVFSSDHHTTNISSQVHNDTTSIPTGDLISLLEEIERLKTQTKRTTIRSILQSALERLFEYNYEVNFDAINRIYLNELSPPIEVYISINQLDYLQGKESFIEKIDIKNI